jgi:hypothetical protein
MRTTVDLPRQLIRLAKRRAADAGVSLCAVVEAALRLYLGSRPAPTAYRLRWRTEKGRPR